MHYKIALRSSMKSVKLEASIHLGDCHVVLWAAII